MVDPRCLFFSHHEGKWKGLPFFLQLNDVVFDVGSQMSFPRNLVEIKQDYLDARVAKRLVMQWYVYYQE